MKKEKLNKLSSAKLSPFAQADLEEIWRYISDDNQESADKIIDEILQKCQFLAKNPKLGRTRHNLIIELRSFPYKRFNIFYFPVENGIEI